MLNLKPNMNISNYPRIFTNSTFKIIHKNENYSTHFVPKYKKEEYDFLYSDVNRVKLVPKQRNRTAEKKINIKNIFGSMNSEYGAIFPENDEFETNSAVDKPSPELPEFLLHSLQKEDMEESDLKNGKENSFQSIRNQDENRDSYITKRKISAHFETTRKEDYSCPESDIDSDMKNQGTSEKSKYNDLQDLLKEFNSEDGAIIPRRTFLKQQSEVDDRTVPNFLFDNFHVSKIEESDPDPLHTQRNTEEQVPSSIISKDFKYSKSESEDLHFSRQTIQNIDSEFDIERQSFGQNIELGRKNYQSFQGSFNFQKLERKKVEKKSSLKLNSILFPEMTSYSTKKMSFLKMKTCDLIKEKLKSTSKVTRNSIKSSYDSLSFIKLSSIRKNKNPEILNVIEQKGKKIKHRMTKCSTSEKAELMQYSETKRRGRPRKYPITISRHPKQKISRNIQTGIFTLKNQTLLTCTLKKTISPVLTFRNMKNKLFTYFGDFQLSSSITELGHTKKFCTTSQRNKKKGRNEKLKSSHNIKAITKVEESSTVDTIFCDETFNEPTENEFPTDISAGQCITLIQNTIKFDNSIKNKEQTSTSMTSQTLCSYSKLKHMTRTTQGIEMTEIEQSIEDAKDDEVSTAHKGTRDDNIFDVDLSELSIEHEIIPSSHMLSIYEKQKVPKLKRSTVQINFKNDEEKLQYVLKLCEEYNPITVTRSPSWKRVEYSFQLQNLDACTGRRNIVIDTDKNCSSQNSNESHYLEVESIPVINFNKPYRILEHKKRQCEYPWNFKLGSWNVNGLRAWMQKRGHHFPRRNDLDILCLQEIRCPLSQIPNNSNINGYHAFWFPGTQKGYAGVALLSKKKPLRISHGFAHPCANEEAIDPKVLELGDGRVITAEYETFFLVNVYAPSSRMDLSQLPVKLKWNSHLHSHLEMLKKEKPIILTGDLNVAYQDIDLSFPLTNRGKSGFTTDERKDFSKLLSLGFVDVYRHIYPSHRDVFTYWPYYDRGHKINGWRLDYFLISHDLISNISDQEVHMQEEGSDHCPQILYLNL